MLEPHQKLNPTTSALPGWKVTRPLKASVSYIVRNTVLRHSKRLCSPLVMCANVSRWPGAHMGQPFPLESCSGTCETPDRACLSSQALSDVRKQRSCQKPPRVQLNIFFRQDNSASSWASLCLSMQQHPEECLSDSGQLCPEGVS